MFRRHPDGVEIVTAVDPCPSGRHHISTRREPRRLVEATRYARTSEFQFARDDSGDRQRPKYALVSAVGLACGISALIWLGVVFGALL